MAVEHVARLDELTRGRHGLVTTEEAVAILGPSRKQRWVAEGRLVSVQPGVLRVAGARETWHQSVMAAVLSAGAVASHRTAAELWGLLPPAGYVEIAVVGSRPPRLRPPAVAHRAADLGRPAPERCGIPLTDPVATIVDLHRVVSVWAVGDALRRGLGTRLLGRAELQALRGALVRQGPGGAGPIRPLLEEARFGLPPEDSAVARRLIALADRHRLAALVAPHEVWHDGRFVARVHAAIPERRLAIEIEGDEPASVAGPGGPAWQPRLTALGWSVLRCPSAELVHRPELVAQTIRAALDRLSAA